MRAKAVAAREWCAHATAWEQAINAKPWRYLLVSDSAITGRATLAGLIAQFG